MEFVSARAGTGWSDQPDRSYLSFGFLLLPSFTLTAFAAFLDAIRLAADEGDKSRQIACRWVVMTPELKPAMASCGVLVQSRDQLLDPIVFHYVIVVGGLLRKGDYTHPGVAAYLRLAAERRVPLIGLGTGSFALAHAGLMRGRRCCVSWYHMHDYLEAFPGHDAVADCLYVIDRDRITCAGGTSVVDVASFLIERHFGRARAMKVLNMLHVDHARPPSTPQWQSFLDLNVKDERVRHAIYIMEENLSSPIPVHAIARAVRMSPRQLQRIFRKATGESLMAFWRSLRLEYARQQLTSTRRSITDIAYDCGFADASHFGRCFQEHYGKSPSMLRG